MTFRLYKKMHSKRDMQLLFLLKLIQEELYPDPCNHAMILCPQPHHMTSSQAAILNYV